MSTIWNIADAGTGIALSNANLTATQAGGTSAIAAVRSTTSFSTGKKYAEATYVGTGMFTVWHIGLADSSGILNGVRLGGDAPGDSIGWQPQAGVDWGIIYQTVSQSSGSAFTPQIGDVIGIAVDIDNKLFYVNDWTQSSGWMPVGSNPSTPTGGGTISAMTTPIFLAWSGGGFTTSDVVTLNPGPSGFTGTIPTGFVAWDAAAVTCGPGSRALMGVGCGIALARKLEENPTLTRRGLLLPWRRSLIGHNGGPLLDE